MWELRDGEFMRFRCRVGHAWTGEALLARHASELDDALWMALRVLEERASLTKQIAERYRVRGMDRMAERFDAQVEDTENRARVVRDSLLQRG